MAIVISFASRPCLTIGALLQTDLYWHVPAGSLPNWCALACSPSTTVSAYMHTWSPCCPASMYMCRDPAPPHQHASAHGPTTSAHTCSDPCQPASTHICTDTPPHGQHFVYTQKGGLPPHQHFCWQSPLMCCCQWTGTPQPLQYSRYLTSRSQRIKLHTYSQTPETQHAAQEC